MSVVDGMIAFNISKDVKAEAAEEWLRELQYDESTTFPFIINTFDIEGPIFIENIDDLRSYADVWKHH